MRTYPNGQTVGDDGVREPAGSLDTARRSLCEASIRPAMWMDFADSIGVGYNAQGRRRLGWVGLTKATVQSRYGHGGEGFWSVGDQPTASPYGPDDLSETGTWVHFQQFSLAGASSSIVAPASITWPDVRGDELWLWSSPTFGESTVHVSVDGVDRATIPLALGGQVPSAPWPTLIGRYGDGSHTVTVEFTAAPGVTLLGVEGRNNNGVRWNSMSHFGWSTPQVSAPAWSGAATPADSLGEWTIHRFADILDLFIYALGGNDVPLTLTPAVSAAQMDIALAKARAVNPDCSILFVANHPGDAVVINGAAYKLTVAAQLEVAEDYNAAVIDHWARTNWTAKNWAADGDGGDTVHPGTKGHAWYAEPAIKMLVGCSPCG